MDSFVQVQELMTDIFQVSEEEISRETTQSDLENWDSLEHLNFMLALEQEFDVMLEVEDLRDLTSVKAILDYLESKQRVL